MIETVHEPGAPAAGGRVALVTGGSRGLGLAMARALLGAGWRVAITGVDAARLGATAAELAAAHGPGRLLALRADVKEAQDAEDAVQATLGAFGRLHALVNNAGLGRITATEHLEPVPFWQAPLQRWHDIMHTNAFGPFHMARAAVPALLAEGAAGFGRIVNISTSATTTLLLTPYGATKAALEMLSRHWARDLAGTGVTVNVLLPGGAADTDIIQGIGTGPDRWFGRALLPPTVMNEALLWLLSDASSGVTGRSFVGKLWDASLPPEQAWQAAVRPLPEAPAII